MRDLYDSDIPVLLRMLGCRGIQGKSYRFKWGEFVPEFGFGLKYSVYHEGATIRIHLLWGCLYLKAPMIISQREGTEDWNADFGPSYHNKGLWWNWRCEFWCLHMPWSWEHVRRTILNADGSANCNIVGYSQDLPEGVKSTHKYTYTLNSGEVQERKATIYGEEREWRWRCCQWLPFPRMIGRSISIDFDGEVGEGAGSWKGGTVGCGYGWAKGETQIECLRRMEKERKFNR